MNESVTQSGGIPVYEWRTAPSHLRTRRQLAADGLRPNGQDIAGKVQRPRRAREPLTAYLYDINRAAAKREPSPAQLAALAKATREHQLRAAERHGLARAGFDQAEDPGPAWTSTSALAGYADTGNALAVALTRDRDRREGMDR
ncbi:RRQRL motif-containing zinc-binding protein [Nocardia altamirensis]|uniref:RRQRL motif-containing zinc-binding protein n=1 Tax=Nocardia altamirensis TaxID=472158 RepID=UPI0008403376|nr:RRQRL motif-containing zinc-binding protein [Nocardia altamirensis]